SFVHVAISRIDEASQWLGDLIARRTAFEQRVAALARQTAELHLRAEQLRAVAVRLDMPAEAMEPVKDIQALSVGLTESLADLEGSLMPQTRLVAEAQEKIFRLRMIPFATLAGRLAQAVAVAAAQSGRR